jgi:UDP-N-acetylmuramate: L-alanyl-gamma-D-glutamyl-meso-diaminopimelate ligase
LARNIFQQELARCLSIADEVVIAGVYRAGKYSDAERLDVAALSVGISATGVPARHQPDADAIVAAIAPELRGGDVVALLSNGGFGGIYEKLPKRLTALQAVAGK